MENLREINCKEIFRKAYENRYTWKNEFKGYKGKCIYFVNNDIHEGEFLLGKNFQPNIQIFLSPPEALVLCKVSF